MIKETLEKILNTLEKCCEKAHQNDKSESDINKSDNEIKKILASALKISVDNVELSDSVITIKGNSDGKLYIDDMEVDAVSSFGNLKDKENIHTIFVKYDFKFEYCIFKNINLSHSKFKSLSFSDCCFNNKVNFSFAKSKERTSFKNCKFKDEVNFTKTEFENNDFSNIFCSIIFEKKVDFTQFKFNQDINSLLTFCDEVIFDNTEFLKEIVLNRDNFILEDVNFQECIFDKVDIKDDFLQEKNISFKSCKFKKIIAFRKKNIKNITFGTCTFEQGVYFVSCVFSIVNFYNCNFNNAACFYGSTFNMAPNFSQSVFKDSLNLVNIKAKFDFQNLNTTIENIYKPKDEVANDFRDSFRTFKSALIKDNNLLDASNFHKYELYCKEIELKENWNKKGENVKNMTNLEKNVSRIRDFVDFLLLGFYRKLCDHHTDFLKVFNNLILLIALYALFVFGFTWLHNDKLEDTRAILTLFGFFDKFKFCFNIGVGICIVIGAILVLYKIDKNSIKSFLNILKIFQYLPYVKKWLLKIFKKEIFIKFFLKLKIIVLDLWFLIESLIIILLVPCAFYVLFSLFGFFLNLGKDFGYSLLINTLFVSLYICLVYTKSLFFGRYVVLIFSYIVFIIMLIKQPSVIHPLIGKIANESDKFFNYPSLIVLNILYTILLALVLFSLQKTARKNSIVPS